MHDSDTLNRTFHIDDMIEDTPIAIGKEVGFIGINEEVRAIAIKPAQDKR